MYMCLCLSFYGHMMPIRLYATKIGGNMCGMYDMAKGMKGPQIPWLSKVPCFFHSKPIWLKMVGSLLETINFEMFFINHVPWFTLMLCELWLIWNDLVESSLGLAMLQLNEQALNNYLIPFCGLHGSFSTQPQPTSPNMCFGMDVLQQNDWTFRLPSLKLT